MSRDAEHTRLHPLLARRHSQRAFAPAPISDEVTARLFEAARWAPSSRNAQPWAFVLARHEDASAHAAAVDVLTPRNRLWAGDAGLLILALARIVHADGSSNAYALYDLGQAVAQLTLQATSEGLSVHQMGGFDRARAREVFGVPDDHEPVVMIAVGTPGDASRLPEDMRALEAAPRHRKPLETFVFEARFGTALATQRDTPSVSEAGAIPAASPSA